MVFVEPRLNHPPSPHPPSVSITVAAVNDVPTAVNDSFVAREGGPASGNLLANDSDVDGQLSLDTTPVSGPANGQVTLNDDGTFTYVGDPGFVGEDEFVYRVSDGSGGFSTATGKQDVLLQQLRRC